MLVYTLLCLLFLHLFGRISQLILWLDSPKPSVGFDFVMVVVDRLLAKCHFLACKKTNDAVYVANMFSQEVVRLHKVPKFIVMIVMSNI